VKLGGSMKRRRGARGSASAPVRRDKPRPDEAKALRADALRVAGRTVVLGLVGLGMGFLIATQLLFPAPPPPENLVEVPELQGLTVDRARARLADAGLEVGEIEGLRHPELDSGMVVGQGPLGGQLAAPGAPIRMTVSLGPHRQAVPDVSQLLGERAIRVLEATGFRVSVDTAEAELPAGTVMTTDPPPGTVLAVPGDVRITLSRGPALVAMPYLLGVAQEIAVDSLANLGIGVAAIDTVFRFGRDQGLVVEQSPRADSLLPRGSQVRLTVGRRGGG
jgi:beta-lactam-binding protein with PASTA domain